MQGFEYEYEDGDIVEAYNPVTGLRKRYMQIDENTGMIVTEFLGTQQMLDDNAEQRAASMNTRWGSMQKVATLPTHLMFDKLGDAVRANDQAYLNKWLNDPDNSQWRTREGRI